MIRFGIFFVVMLGSIRPALAQTNASISSAVNRALPPLQKSAAEFVAQRACVSCHHNALPILFLHAARARGFSIDSKVLDAVEQKTFRELRAASALDDAIQGAAVADPTPNDSYLLLAARAAGLAPDLVTAVYVRRMTRWQRDGHWITSDFRPPHSSSLFTSTATAVRAIQTYMPAELAAERDEAIRNARAWLFATKPLSTEDAAFRVMGLVWAGASPEDMRAASRDLLSLQKPDGGWSQLPPYDSDAYSTGEALFALHEAGVPDSAAQQKGLRFLTSTQARDGTWRVRTRMVSPATVSPPYFATGFPYGKDEFLSYAGTSWAVLALLSALPETSGTSVGATPTANSSAPAQWARTALFGTSDELRRLLDSGLDPNSSTPNGTTLLMMVAPDSEKTRLVLGRGAKAATRTNSGVDALTSAASYYGTSASGRLLLDAGATPQPPEGVRVRRSPLTLASMTGDIAFVRLLLQRGATPAADALAESVTFGHAEIASELIAAGADSSIRESSGVNLLHWATITNRASVIPVLARAKVPLDAVDESGYTPLMYAASVDQGNTDVLRELLKAGADRRVRNLKGQTAADLARSLKHTALAEALK